MKIIISIILFSILTLITQIGGAVYILSLTVSRQLNFVSIGNRFLIFSLLYLFITIAIVPIVAPIFGREPVVNTDNIQPTNYLSVLLNRNYVQPELNILLVETSKQIRYKKLKISYLDASFPFINNFPLLPHLSHKDGKKIDISLIYEKPNGVISNKQKSVSGYGIFEKPKKQEINQIRICKNKGYFQYSYPQYLSLGSINSELIFSEKGTKVLILELLNNKNLGKLFIEPHLKQRLSLNNPKIRYHGCRAVRHDDHIHIQLL